MRDKIEEENSSNDETVDGNFYNKDYRKQRKAVGRSYTVQSAVKMLKPDEFLEKNGGVKDL